MAKKRADDELGFEQAMERVESIVSRIESGQIGLEDALAQYEEGAALVKRCRELLDRARQRVTDLTAQLNASEPPRGQADQAREQDPPF